MFSADRNPFNVDDHHGSPMSHGLSPYGGPGGGGGMGNAYVTPPDRIRQDPLRLLFQQLQHDEHNGGLVDSPENALIYNLLVQQTFHDNPILTHPSAHTPFCSHALCYSLYAKNPSHIPFLLIVSLFSLSYPSVLCRIPHISTVLPPPCGCSGAPYFQPKRHGHTHAHPWRRLSSSLRSTLVSQYSPSHVHPFAWHGHGGRARFRTCIKRRGTTSGRYRTCIAVTWIYILSPLTRHLCRRWLPNVSFDGSANGIDVWFRRRDFKP